MRKFLALCALVAALVLSWAAPAFAQGNVVVIQGEITENTTLSRNNQYLLRGAVFVRAPATLVINAGTQIFGEQATLGTLIVDRGARIVVNGNKNNPVVMTSDQPVGQRARGDWGGLIINGFAPLNVPGGEAEGEGDTGTYGGNLPNDDSGSIKYLRVEFAGIEFSPDNELNCVALQGVGRGTLLQFIQCLMNKDDGFEFFGGTALLRFAVATAIGDDSFDATDGWTGAGQFWIAAQVGDDADQGFEIDNNGENNSLTPVTAPFVTNFTLIGDDSGVYGTESDIGMLIREGAAGTWQNGVIAHFGEEGLKFDQRATFNNAQAGTLTVRSNFYAMNGLALGRLARTEDEFGCGWDGGQNVANEVDNPSNQNTCRVTLGGNNDVDNHTDLWTYPGNTPEGSDVPDTMSTRADNWVEARQGGKAVEPDFAYDKSSILYDGSIEPAAIPSNITYAGGKRFFNQKGAKFIGAAFHRGSLGRWWSGWTNWETDVTARVGQ